MAENINLLPQQNDENTAQARQRRMINQISIIALVLSIVAVVVLFSGQFILGQQIKGIEEEIQTQQSRIQAKKAEEGIQRSLISRVEALDSFFKTQKHFSLFMDEIINSSPETLNLDDMEINEVNDVVMSGKIGSYGELAGFHAKLSMAGAPAGSTEGTYFTNPVLTSIKKDEDAGGIEFTMEVEISESLLQESPEDTGAQL